MGLALDDTDLGMLRLLAQDARIAIEDLAVIVGRSEKAVVDRIRALEDVGIIEAYCMRVHREALGLMVEALVCADADQEVLRRRWDVLQRHPYLLSADLVTGPKRLLLRIAARDAAHLENIVAELGQSLELRSTETQVVLQQLVGTRILTPRAPQTKPVMI